MSEPKFQSFSSCSTPSDKDKVKRRGLRKSLFQGNSETPTFLQLTDGLRILSTEINEPSTGVQPEGGMLSRDSGLGGNKKLSMDDGCCLESPAVSSHSSPCSLVSRSIKPKSSTRFNLLKRFGSDPIGNQLPHVMVRRRSEDKENCRSLRTISERGMDISPFKCSPSHLRPKRVAFRNETNIMSASHRRPLASSCSLIGDFLHRQESSDDGFFDHGSSNSSNSCDTPSTKVDLPKNFERLLFSPVIDAGVSRRTGSASPPPSAANGNFTSLKINSFNIDDFSTCSNFPTVFQSPAASNEGIFKQPTLRLKPAPNAGNKIDCKFSSARVLLRSESVNNDHNTSSSSSSSDDSLCMEPVDAKRRKNNGGQVQGRKQLKKCQSMAALSIKSALKRDEVCPDLIGDFTREYSLPLVTGRHQDLKCISIDTMAHLLSDHYQQLILDFVIVDCRYPYEFDGGHIRGAINLHSHQHILDRFFSPSKSPLCHRFSTTSSPVSVSNSSSPCNETLLAEDSSSSHNSSDDDKENCLKQRSSKASKAAKRFQERNSERRSIIIFHCEFSSERGPQMSRFLRSKDREESFYPTLKYPELYLLEGGYKAFFEQHPGLCEPQGYVQMHHPCFQDQLKLFKCRSSSSLFSKSCPKSLWN